MVGRVACSERCQALGFRDIRLTVEESQSSVARVGEQADNTTDAFTADNATVDGSALAREDYVASGESSGVLQSVSSGALAQD